jgi:carbamoylphosphate synthase large subunit
MMKGGIPVANDVDWTGKEPIPQAPFPCWIIPATDEVATYVAARQSELREAGWKVLASTPHIVDRLNNKASFQRYVAELGLSAHLPRFHIAPEGGLYPCILKPATGEYGYNMFIVNSSAATREIVGNISNFEERWVLQELIPGQYEYSASMLVNQGKILATTCVRYTYDKETYIWPNVKELARTVCDLPAEHLEIMRRILVGYSGFCNFNYKVRPDGRLCLFEANARVGGDLACDVPVLRPDLGRAMFEKLEAIGNRSGQQLLAEGKKERRSNLLFS